MKSVFIQTLEEGSNQIPINFSNYSSGMYYYSIVKEGAKIMTKKMELMR